MRPWVQSSASHTQGKEVKNESGRVALIQSSCILMKTNLDTQEDTREAHVRARTSCKLELLVKSSQIQGLPEQLVSKSKKKRWLRGGELWLSG